MKKVLLLVLALVIGLAEDSQAQVRVNGHSTVSIAPTQKTISFDPVPTQQVSTVVKPIQKKPKSANVVNVITLGTSANALGWGYGSATYDHLWADNELKAIIQIHRMGPGSSPPSLSGYLAMDHALNYGTNSSDWSTNYQVYAAMLTGGTYYVDAGRYPQGGLYNPPGNTDPTNSYLTYFAPNLSYANTGGTWGGYSYGRGKWNIQCDSTKHLDWYNPPPSRYGIPEGFTITALGKVFVIDRGYDANTGVYNDNLYLETGTWSSTTHDFSYTPSLLPMIGNLGCIPTTAKVQADPSGNHIWICAIGNNGGASPVFDSTYYPVFFHSSDGGVTWGSPIAITLDGPNGLPAIKNYISNARLAQVFSSVPPRDQIAYTTVWDGDLTVDKWGNPHFFVGIGLPGTGFSIYVPDGANSPLFDSTYAMFDIYSVNLGTSWCARMVGVVKHFNCPTLSASAAAPIYNHPNVSRNAVGDKVFFTWLDSWGSSLTDNSAPDVFARGWDILTNKLTNNSGQDAGTNVTYQSSVSGTAFAGDQAQIVFTKPDGSWQIPIVTEGIQGLVLDNPVTYYYISNFSYTQSNFTINGNGPAWGSTCNFSGGQSVTLITPNGGENWLVGSIYNILWTSNGITNVKIEYSINNGTSWNIITSSYIAGTGSYLWTIPNTPSNQCKVRISDSGNPSMVDISNNTFTITTNTQAITLNTPNGGENWQVGSAQNITWISTGINNVKIEYSINNGTSWTTVVSTYSASAGTYNWVVPNTPSTACKVRISDASNTSLNDVSDCKFTISSSSTSSITIISPNGSENWQVGSTHNITWSSTGINNIKIEYTTDNGSSWSTIVSSYSASSGSYTWIIPNTPSTQCKVRISDVNNSSTYDLSDNTFTISSGSPSITVISPNGGENWQVGNTQNIIWASNGITNVKIEYTYDNGSSWITIVNGYPATIGSYSWVVPNTPSTQCKVKISDASNLSFYDISDNTFTITSGSSSSIMVLSPNGGEIWQVGSSYNIAWTSTGVSFVNIEYSTNNGTSWSTIVSNFPSTSNSSYPWTVPNTPSNQCRVRITDASNSNTWDQSDNVFTILGGGSAAITVLSPNGNEIWQVGFTYFIIWNSINITNVRIDYSLDNGVSWIPIVYSTPASVGYYSWTVPNTPSLYCKVRISDAANPAFFDDSDNVFRIAPATGMVDKVQHQIDIFPNPTSGIARLQSDSPIQTLCIYNSFGIEIYKTEPWKADVTFDLLGNPKGIYFLRITIEGIVFTYKVILI